MLVIPVLGSGCGVETDGVLWLADQLVYLASSWPVKDAISANQVLGIPEGWHLVLSSGFYVHMGTHIHIYT